MKLLVRRVHTGKFYAGESGWTDDPAVALPFSSAAAACNEFSRASHNLELVVRSEVVGSDIAIPLLAMQYIPIDAGAAHQIRI